MTFRLVWEEHRVTVRYSGHVNHVQASMATRLIQGDPRSDGLREVVHDGRECTSTTFSETLIEEIAAIDGAAALSIPKLRIAVISDRPDVIAAVAYYLSLGLSPFPVRVFADLEAANDWLGS